MCTKEIQFVNLVLALYNFILLPLWTLLLIIWYEKTANGQLLTRMLMSIIHLLQYSVVVNQEKESYYIPRIHGQYHIIESCM